MCERLKKRPIYIENEESLEEATPGIRVNRHSEVGFEGGATNQEKAREVFDKSQSRGIARK